jgi:hypothetical protein
MGNAVMQIGTDEMYLGKPDAAGFNDPFPTIPLQSTALRNLVETRAAALQGKSLPHPYTWNDVVYGYRSVYGRHGNEFGNYADRARKVPGLLAAYSPAAMLRYTNGAGGVQGTTDTDAVGNTVTFPNSQILDSVRMQAATGVSTVTLPAGTIDNLVWVVLHHAEPTAGQSPVFSFRRTAATDFLSFVRTNATTVTVTRTVASTPTTERTITIPNTEPLGNSAYAMRINGAVASFYVNGIQYDSWTLNAASQAFTGINVGFDVAAAARGALGEFEVWNTNPLQSAS